MKKEVVLVFQKNEVLGKVKTRLAAGVGEEQALETYRQLLAKTYLALMDVSVSITTYFSEFIPDNPIHTLPQVLHLIMQKQDEDMQMPYLPVILLHLATMEWQMIVVRN